MRVLRTELSNADVVLQGGEPEVGDADSLVALVDNLGDGRASLIVRISSLTRSNLCIGGLGLAGDNLRAASIQWGVARGVLRRGNPLGRDELLPQKQRS